MFVYNVCTYYHVQNVLINISVAFSSNIHGCNSAMRFIEAKGYGLCMQVVFVSCVFLPLYLFHVKLSVFMS